MKKIMPKIILAALALTLTTTCPAFAHHEAIFGPQASIMLSAGSYVSVQGFSRQTGTNTERKQETTGLIGFGFTPIPDIPVGINVIAPFSSISELDKGGGKTGIEDVVIGLNYRYDLTDLNNKFGTTGNYILGMSAIELTNGVIDHEAFQGPIDSMYALIGSTQIGPFAGLLYGLLRHNAADGVTKDKAGDNLYLGGGLTYSQPLEVINKDSSINFQLGMSYETYFADIVEGKTDNQSGGRGVLIHPTIIFLPGNNTQIFGLVSIPVWQSYADPTGQDRFRVGAGVVYSF